MKTNTIFCLLLGLHLLLPYDVFAQSGPYSRLRFSADVQTLHQLALNGVALDHIAEDSGVYTGEFSAEETALIQQYGMHVSVLIADLEKYFITQNSGLSIKRAGLSYPQPAGFTYGAMNGYFTLEQADSHFAVMQQKYPGIFSVWDTIGSSVQGRPIRAFKVSDNVLSDEDEVEVMYTALHHAREPISLSQMVYYLYYVLENYGSNAEVKAIVDNSEMYFIPVVNPDGYAYNQSRNPAGGGYWRKNRTKNSDGSYGVDLNRNYGHFWGLNDAGSSPVTTTETYRGLQAFSEPETRAVRDFCNKRHFAANLNYHASGSYLIYPWGPDNGPSTTTDVTLFTDMAKELTVYNKYSSGTCFETLKYLMNGAADDWMYGENGSKPRIISFTPEVGKSSDGFWPLKNRILTLCDENILQNLNLVRLMLGWSVGLEGSGAESREPALYPNPSTGMVYVSADLQGWPLEITDVCGRRQEVLPAGPDGNFNLSHLPDGVYTCRFTGARGEVSVYKIILCR